MVVKMIHFRPMWVTVSSLNSQSISQSHNKALGADVKRDTAGASY
jgi:hypothetical protein